MFRNLRWLALGAGAVGCSEWPRFVHPSNAVEPYAGEVGVKYYFSELDLGPDGAPDDPAGIAEPDPSWFTDPYVALQIDGLADPVAALVKRSGEVPFEECGGQAEPPIRDHYYDGDVDFYRVPNPHGTLCFVLRTQVPTGRYWDVIAYAYDAGTDCIKGQFLTQRSVDDPNVAAYTVEGGWNSLTSDATDIAFYVAGSDATSGDDVPYTVYVYPTHFERVCETLTAEQFVPVEQQETP